jgi:hypothetical protein
MSGKLAAYLFILLVCLIAGLPQSCVNNNAEDLYPPPPCDTTDVTWDSKISAIMQKNCVECHNSEQHPNDVRHDTYAFEMIVVNDGRLRGVVNHLPGYVKMPKDRAKLPECELKLINFWLDHGAPEN